MNAPKPSTTLSGNTCRECGVGKFELVQITHIEKIPNDNPVTVADIWVERCNHCGEVIFPGETVCYIEAIVAEQTEQLKGEDLEQIREFLGVQRQDDMSEILGLGEKTFHKWESGSQVPTRSMSFYIRILAEFPEAFHWLKSRSWRAKNRVAISSTLTDWSAMFPDLPQQPSTESELGLRISSRTLNSDPKSLRHGNPALGLISADFQTR
jgi:putative zinc finger/helix-turn-helix YgiT family protein